MGFYSESMIEGNINSFERFLMYQVRNEIKESNRLIHEQNDLIKSLLNEFKSLGNIKPLTKDNKGLNEPLNANEAVSESTKEISCKKCGEIFENQGKFLAHTRKCKQTQTS